MFAGHAFRYVREAPITFSPTYKFDKHTADPLGYDSSEKRRVPAWTDRIFFRGSAFIKNAIEVEPYSMTFYHAGHTALVKTASCLIM